MRPTGEVNHNNGPDLSCAFCGRPPHPDNYGHSYRPQVEPKPTGEWTRETVLAIARSHIGADAISDAVAAAHNAALASERSQLADLLKYAAKLDERNDELEQQLAAEREKVKLMEYRLSETEIRFREQLTAERERLEAKWKASMADVITSLDGPRTLLDG